MKVFNPFTKKLQRLQEVGGKYGINIETLTGDKTLTPNIDYVYQYLDEGGADRIITLDTANAKAGDRFVIKHNGSSMDTHFLEVKQGATSLDKIYAEKIAEFIFDGSGWVDADNGTGHGFESYRGLGLGTNAKAYECGAALGYHAEGYKDGVAVGTNALGYNYGIGIGYSADGKEKGVAIGDTADGYAQGVALGYWAKGYSCGTALGYYCNTNSKKRSIALGYLSKNTRYAELAMNMGDEIDNDMEYQYQQIVIGSWVRKTTNDTPITMAVDGNKRFTIRSQSALTFKIMVTARDNTTGDCAAYVFDGLIKRDGANNTILCVCNKTVLHEDDATWDCDVAADDVNEALQITVTGDATNTVRWAARLDGVETSFTAA